MTGDTAPDPSRRALLAAGPAALAALAVRDTEARKRRPRPPAFEYSQSGWRFCTKCRGLFLSPKAEPAGVCPAGGKHAPLKPQDYVLYAEEITSGDNLTEMYRCGKCAGLFLDGTVPLRCPAGGGHAATGNQFSLWNGPGIPGMTDGAWDFCDKCAGVYNWAGGFAGVCPAGGGHARGSYTFKLVVRY